MTNKKSRKHKKRNVTKISNAVRDNFYRNVWMVDSSIDDDIRVIYPDRVGNALLPIPKATIATWIARLNKERFMWRFVTYGFNIAEESYEFEIHTVDKPTLSLELTATLDGKLNHFLSNVKRTFDSWGAIIIPSLDVDIEAMEEEFLNYFIDKGLTNQKKLDEYDTMKGLEMAKENETCSAKNN